MPHSQPSVEVKVYRSAGWITAVDVDRGVRRQVLGDRVIADSDLELRQRKDSLRDALQ